MTYRSWTSDYVRHQFPYEVKAELRKEGKDPDIKPKQSWLNEHGFGGIRNYADRNGVTIDTVLLDECGFEPREQRPLPGMHTETKELIRQWLREDEKEDNQLSHTSIPNAWSHMRRLLAFSKNIFQSSDLLRSARVPSGKNVQLTIDLFREMNHELPSESARYNYGATLASFYQYLEINEEIESNPVRTLLPPVDWSGKPRTPGRLLTPVQIGKCWIATEEALEDNGDENTRKKRLYRRKFCFCPYLVQHFATMVRV